MLDVGDQHNRHFNIGQLLTDRPTNTSDSCCRHASSLIRFWVLHFEVFHLRPMTHTFP